MNSLYYFKPIWFFSKQNRLVSANWYHAWKILVKAFWLTSSAQLEITNELRKWHCLPCRPSHWDKGSRLSSSMLLPYWQLLLKSKSYTGRMPSSSKRGTLFLIYILVLLKVSGSHMVMIFGDKRVIVSYITIHFITILLLYTILLNTYIWIRSSIISLVFYK